MDETNLSLRSSRDTFPAMDLFQANDRERSAPPIVVTTLRTASLLEQVVARALSPYKLHWAQFNALLLLKREAPDGLRPSAIGDFLCISRPNVTKTLTRLLTRGLIEELPDPLDGRAIRAFITRSGEHVLGRASETLRRDLGRVVAMSPASETRALQELLDQFRDRLSSVLGASEP